MRFCWNLFHIVPLLTGARAPTGLLLAHFGRLFLGLFLRRTGYLEPILMTVEVVTVEFQSASFPLPRCPCTEHVYVW
jgi:hypothetical protein